MTIGLAIVGCGTIGRVRAVLAREHPGIGWLGLCDVDEETATRLGDDTAADLVTTDLEELLAHPEVTAVIVATAENEHVEPIMRSVELGFPLFIEKPLATDPSESAAVLAAIETARGRRGDGLYPAFQAPVPDGQAAAGGRRDRDGHQCRHQGPDEPDGPDSHPAQDRAAVRPHPDGRLRARTASTSVFG